MEKDIAVVVYNYIQYLNVIAGLEEIMKKGYNVDFYCNVSDNNDGFKDLLEDGKKYMIEKGLNVLSEYDNNISYKVLLEPYPGYFKINAKYRIKYRYGNVSAKPNIVYSPQVLLCYDCILCSGDYEADYLKVFAETYKVGNQKYINFKKDKVKNKHKKTLLYLPTYGKESSIDMIESSLDSLRKEYYVIVKIHHGTSFLNSEKKQIDKLKSKVDEFYDLHTKLGDLLQKADVVLTDNSGAIFEALYTEVPVAIFCDDINKNKLGKFNTTQYELYKKGIIPYSNEKNEIINILKMAQDPNIFKKQVEWSRKSFYHPKNLVSDFVDIIEKYLNNDINHRYIEMHDLLKDEYYSLIDGNNYLNNSLNIITEKNDKLEEQNKMLHDDNNILNKQNKMLHDDNNILNKQNKMLHDDNNLLKKQLSYYENGKLYKLAKRIYQLKSKEK